MNHDFKTSNLVPYIAIIILLIIIVAGGYILTNLWLDAKLLATKNENSFNEYMLENEKWKKKQTEFTKQQEIKGVWHVTTF